MTTACTSYTRAARLRKTAVPRTERARSHARLARATIRKPQLRSFLFLKSSCRYDWFMPRLTDIWCTKLLVYTWTWSAQYMYLGYRACATWHINRIQYSFDLDLFEPRYTLSSFTQSVGSQTGFPEVVPQSSLSAPRAPRSPQLILS